MPDPNVRSDSVNVEQIMEQIRARIREKRGVDVSEQQVRELAATKLDKLLEQSRRGKPSEQAPNFTFEADTLFESPSGLVRAIRRLLRPLLRLFVNPAVLSDALHVQSRLNARQAQLEASRHMLYDELIHNLVIESARLGLEVKSLKMHVESLATRLEFSERRVRTIESTTVYQPSADERRAAAVALTASVPTPSSSGPSFSPPPFSPSPSASPVPSMPAMPASTSSFAPSSAPAAQPMAPGPRPVGPGPSAAPDGQRRRRRRRRRGRRGGGPGAAAVGSPFGAGGPAGADPASPHASPETSAADAAGHEAEIDEPGADAFTDDGGPNGSTNSEPDGPDDNE